MTLTARLITIMTVCLGLAVAGVTLAMGYLARDALIVQAEGQARLVAGLISESVNRSDLASAEIFGLLRQEQEGTAVAIAHLAEAVADQDDPAVPLSTHLAEITAQTVIDDIWIVDGALGVIERSFDGLGEPVLSDIWSAGIDPRIPELLTSGRRYSIATTAVAHGVLEQPMRYLGVRAADHRAVLIGRQATQLDAVQDTIGLETTINSLSGQPAFNAIWVVNDRMRVIAASEQDRSPSTQEVELAAKAIGSLEATSTLAESALLVAAPILDRDGLAVGASMIRMPRAALDTMVADTMKLGGAAAVTAFALGSLVAAAFARRITRPVAALTHAAAEVDARTFAPASLDVISTRRDEIGRMALTFQKMATDVLAREDHLEGLVRERTRDLREKNALLEDANNRMEAELEIARSLQAAILPQVLPSHPSYTGRAFMTPALELAGDFYDFFSISDDRLGLVIADVSGKGVSAAFFMAICRTVLQASAREHRSAGDCLQAVNDTLCAQNPLTLFVTVFYGILDVRSGEFTYANAGHNPPLRIEAGGGVAPLPLTGGMALGILPDLPYNEGTVRLSPGDTVFLYTDGISEAMDGAGHEFTDGRLIQSLSASHRQSVDVMLDTVTGAVRAFVGDAPQSDDITCLVIRYRGWQGDPADAGAAAGMTDPNHARHDDA
ncbi:MAG: SpoIIE family protein phosphatase [Rhodospirillaceae bacterium]|nr:SpoIIE family protein phosphatase [Rhodospirillaceae bacterium]